MLPIRDAADLAAALTRPRAVLFLYVNWSGPARVAKANVNALVTRWQAECPELTASFHVADLSDQEGEVWDAVREWLGSAGRPVDVLTYGGYGALIWVRAGRIVAATPSASYQRGVLFAATKSMFA